MNNQADLFIIAAPSGTGKTSLVNTLVTKLENIVISISFTTRLPRPADRDGIDYFFINRTQFESMIKDEVFLEHAEVYGHCYGTSRNWVERHLAEGKDVILEIDWQGARQVISQFPEAVSIFILPPSVETLRQRLQHRQQDVLAIITQRMSMAYEEMTHYKEFDYLIINDDFNQALKDLQHVILAQRLTRRRQQQKQAALLAQLLKTQ